MSNTDIVISYLAKLDAGDVEGAQKRFAPEFEFVSPFGAITDRQSHTGLAEGFNNAFPDQTHGVDRSWELEDAVIVEGTWRGVNTGPLALPDGTVVPATGKSVVFAWAGIGHVEAG